MRYTSFKGILLQIRLVLVMAGINFSPLILFSVFTGISVLQVWDYDGFVGLYGLIAISSLILFPVIRGAVLKRKITDYPRRGKANSFFLWLALYVVVLIISFIAVAVVDDIAGNVDMWSAGFFLALPVSIVLVTIMVALSDYRLVRLNSPVSDDSRRKKWSESRKRQIKFYSPKGLIIQIAYLLLILALFAAAWRMWFDFVEFGDSAVDITAVWIILLAAITLLLVRDRVLYRFITDFPKRSFGTMMIKGLGFLAVFIAIFGVWALILEVIVPDIFLDMELERFRLLVAVHLIIQIKIRDHFLLKSASREKTFICPYCFVKNFIWNVHFRCANPACADVPDIELTQYENNGNASNPISNKRTFPAVFKKLGFGMMPKRGKCPGCSTKTSRIVCSSCHNHLPDSSLLGEDIIISIVGPHDAGKSHYLGVLIHELLQRVSASFERGVVGVSDSGNRCRDRFFRRLYGEKSTLDFTDSVLSPKCNGTFKPLIFEWVTKNKKKKHTLVFYETAGTDLEDLDTMSTVHRFLSKSAGIIFLLDPLQIAAVAHHLDSNTLASASGQRPGSRRYLMAGADEILGRISTLIRNDNNIQTTQKIDIPMAAVLSKLDAIGPFLPSGLTLSKQSPHCPSKGFVLADAERVDLETKHLLKHWGEGSFMAQLDVNYEKQAYFAVSALGANNSPRADRTIDAPRPHRIEDPLLWLLRENGVIELV